MSAACGNEAGHLAQLHYSVGSTLYTKLYLRKLIDEGTGSTFNALESRGFIKCKYTWKCRDGSREALERFLMLQITPAGRKLVRSATGAKAYRPGSPGTLREWHWKAMAEVWKARPAGVKSEYGEDYGHIGWNTWLRLSALGEQFYRENWQRYREMYPEVDAPAPDASEE